MKRALFTLILLGTLASSAFAHEVRPAYLELRQIGPETYDALWKVPGQGDLRLGLYVELPRDLRQRHRAGPFNGQQCLYGTLVREVHG